MSQYQAETTSYVVGSKPPVGMNGEKKEFAVIPEGKYYAHVDAIEKKIGKDGSEDYTIKGRGDKDGQQHLAYLLNVTYKIAEGDFKNRLVWSNAIWLFRQPPSAEYTANPEGNQRYNYFLEAVQYPVEMAEMEDAEGNPMKVRQLPVDYDSSKIVGMPVIITVKHRSYKADGVEKVSANEAYIDSWNDGQQIQSDDDDLPF